MIIWFEYDDAKKYLRFYILKYLNIIYIYHLNKIYPKNKNHIQKSYYNIGLYEVKFDPTEINNGIRISMQQFNMMISVYITLRK